MKPVSNSPGRHTFQKEAYLEHCKQTDTEPSESYLDLFDSILQQSRNKWNSMESTEDNMEYDLLTTDWILEKVRSSKSYAQNLYAAMCNREFRKLDVLPILMEKTWGCSWRSAGGIIADMRLEGDYIDWYCSGIGNHETGYGLTGETGNAYVSEGVVTEEIENDLKTLGWIVLPEIDD